MTIREFLDQQKKLDAEIEATFARVKMVNQAFNKMFPPKKAETVEVDNFLMCNDLLKQGGI